MTHYVDNSKADKARRKKLVSIGITTKTKAKALLKEYSVLNVYGMYLDGAMEIGLLSTSVWATNPKAIEIFKRKVANA